MCVNWNYSLLFANLFLIATATMAGNCSDGEMRLVGTLDSPITMTRVGTVEVCVNNAWGSVCRNGFNSPEADIVCNLQSGFTGIGKL